MSSSHQSSGRINPPPEPISSRERVKDVFDRVADRYDLMNDLISLGTHRLLKRMMVELAAVRRGHRVLDLATGTGDMAALLADKVGDEGLVIASDINAAMLELGRDRLLDKGIVDRVAFLQGDAERISFGESSLDRVTIAFGLRNVADKEAALRECHRVLRPGGRLVILEFSTPPLAPVAAAFSLVQRTWPVLGRLVTGSGESYRYLRESIARHPDQERLQSMLEAADFTRARYYNLLGGMAAFHLGIKP